MDATKSNRRCSIAAAMVLIVACLLTAPAPARTFTRVAFPSLDRDEGGTPVPIAGHPAAARRAHARRRLSRDHRAARLRRHVLVAEGPRGAPVRAPDGARRDAARRGLRRVVSRQLQEARPPRGVHVKAASARSRPRSAASTCWARSRISAAGATSRTTASHWSAGRTAAAPRSPRSTGRDREIAVVCANARKRRRLPRAPWRSIPAAARRSSRRALWRPRCPARILIGELDDWTPAKPCVELGQAMARTRRAAHGDRLSRAATTASTRRAATPSRTGPTCPTASIPARACTSARILTMRDEANAQAPRLSATNSSRKERLHSNRKGSRWISSLRASVVVVTGASKGIGFACARGFVREGARVAIVSRSRAEPRRRAGAPAARRACAHRDRRRPRRMPHEAARMVDESRRARRDRRARQFRRRRQALRARRARRRTRGGRDGRQVLQLHPPDGRRRQAHGRARRGVDRQHHRHRAARSANPVHLPGGACERRADARDRRASPPRTARKACASTASTPAAR